jgi:hypothetical protein
VLPRAGHEATQARYQQGSSRAQAHHALRVHTKEFSKNFQRYTLSFAADAVEQACVEYYCELTRLSFILLLFIHLRLIS